MSASSRSYLTASHANKGMPSSDRSLDQIIHIWSGTSRSSQKNEGTRRGSANDANDRKWPSPASIFSPLIAQSKLQTCASSIWMHYFSRSISPFSFPINWLRSVCDSGFCSYADNEKQLTERRHNRIYRTLIRLLSLLLRATTLPLVRFFLSPAICFWDKNEMWIEG